MPHSRGLKTNHTITWRGIRCRITHQRDFMGEGWSQLEIEVLDPAQPPLPVTDSGYYAHHCDEDDIAKAGGTEVFVLRMLDAEANNAAYAKYLAKWQQLRMF